METEGKRMVTRGWGREDQGHCLMVAEFPFCKMERVLGIGCRTM